MTEEDFKIRKQNAVTLIRREIDRINKEEQRLLINPYDTGAGHDWHNYYANERAKQNGRVSKDFHLRTRQYYDVLDYIDDCTQDVDIWNKMNQHCIVRVIEGKVNIADSGYNNETSKAWRIVSSQFWV